MSSQVFFIQNPTTQELLTWDGSSVTTHLVLAHPNNFCVNHVGGTVSEPQYCIQRFNDSTQKLLAAESTENEQTDIPTSSAQTVWYAVHDDSGDAQSGIKLYTMTSDNNKWYLRTDTFLGGASLVSEYLINQTNFIEAEILFNLVSVDANSINNS